MDEWYWCQSCNVHGRGRQCWSCRSTLLETNTDELMSLEMWAKDNKPVGLDV